MYKLRICLSAAAALLLILGLGGPAAMAFHDGGVAHCDGCHTMHNSVDGAAVTPNPNSSLLAGSDPSSVCLNCHGEPRSYSVYSEDGSNLKPGGDFFWTSVDISWVVRGNPVTRKGYENGHSIAAQDFPDLQNQHVLETLTTSPGGNYPTEYLGCQSCHDPHGVKKDNTDPISGSGSYGDTPAPGTVLGNYRLLGDENYSPKFSGVTFDNPPPVALAIANGDTETDAHHNDYGSGTSEWCANCHGDFQVAGTGAGKHPSGGSVKLGAYVANYNKYVATGDTGGVKADAYFALVPIERGTSDQSVLNTDSTEGATDTQDNVSCLTCHRAHASAFEFGTRWDTTTEFLADSHPTTGDTVSKSDAATLKTNSYYGRDIVTTYGEFQRSLCNKCHLKD